MPGMMNPLGLAQVQQQQQVAPALATTTPAPVGGYAQIPGTLPWGSGGAGMFTGLSGDPASAMANLGANYATSYNDALAMNRENYNNILQGYGNVRQQQAEGYANAGNALGQSLFETAQGYGVLDANVQNALAGAENARRQQIMDTYTAQRGQAEQSLVSRGLGNTTVLDSVLGGIGTDEAKAYNDLASQMAQLRAGYQANIGLAGLGFRGQAAGQVANQANLATGNNAALAAQQLAWQNSVNAAYPQAGLYSQLAQQYGAIGQVNADRALLAQQSAYRPPVQGNLPQVGGQYVPAGGGFPTPNPGFGGAGGYLGGGGVPAASAAGFGYNFGNQPYGSPYGNLNYSPGSYGDIFGEGAFADQYDTAFSGGGDWSTGEPYGGGFWGDLAGAASAYAGSLNFGGGADF